MILWCLLLKLPSHSEFGQHGLWDTVRKDWKKSYGHSDYPSKTPLLKSYFLGYPFFWSRSQVKLVFLSWLLLWAQAARGSGPEEMFVCKGAGFSVLNWTVFRGTLGREGNSKIYFQICHMSSSLSLWNYIWNTFLNKRGWGRGNTFWCSLVLCRLYSVLVVLRF